MAIEIERKFRVHTHLWEATVKPEGELYRQGYLLTDPLKTIRVRVAGSRGFITIKGRTEGASRQEFEYEIPVEDAVALLDGFAETELSKTRFKIPFEGKLWEVDVFLGSNAGLIIAEIELNSEDESFALPPWVSTEVTGDARYYNSSLSRNPFSTWSD